jgi:hypothetical protein
MPNFQPSAGTSSSSSSEASPDQDSTHDYPEIRGSVCWNPAEEGRLIIMVAPAKAPSQNTTSQYPTIGRSKASGAQTPEDRMIRNLNPDFNAVRLQTIMETVQHMVLEGSPLGALAQQGIEAANNVVEAERSTRNRRAEHSPINDRMAGRGAPGAKQQHRSATTNAWPTTTCVSG